MWSAGRPARQRGFTLVELLVVLGIVAMVAVLVAPRLGGMGSGMELRGAAEELRADIRRVRNAAVSESRDTVLLFDLEAGAWRDGDGRLGGTLPEGVELAITVARQEQTGEASGGVRFYPDGTSTGAKVTLSRGERALLLSIDWFDGHVRIAAPEA